MRNGNMPETKKQYKKGFVYIFLYSKAQKPGEKGVGGA